MVFFSLFSGDHLTLFNYSKNHHFIFSAILKILLIQLSRMTNL